ncbi:hypothetical protein C8A00DRAFT_38066, partial [Chaetomidium leptoderma]
MAEPFAVIGLAASILTLIEELDLIVQHVRSLSSALLASPTLWNLSQDERSVLAMAARWNQLAPELGGILQILRVRDTAWSRTIDTGRVVFQTMRKKKTIDALQTRLANISRTLREESDSQ